jgi:hypothetical protein
MYLLKEKFEAKYSQLQAQVTQFAYVTISQLIQ